MKNVHSETNRSFYDRISHSYDLIADAGEHTAREKGERALYLQPGESVLEIGFGTGNSLLYFVECVGPDGAVAGVDISPRMRDVAEEKLRARSLQDWVCLKIGDARQLPFDDNHFDAVFMSFTLELFPATDIPLVLDEVERVLKPDGRTAVVAMASPNELERASTLERTYVWMHRHFPHIVDCQPINAASFLKNTNFAITSEEEVEIWTMPVRITVGQLSPVAV
jgi:ubiquinone/menaquinone biosynthesis C-methylase UbiE